LVGRQEGHPACENFEWWGTGVVICLERDTDLHMAQLMPLPLTVSCFSEIQIGFTFLVPAGTWVVPEKGPLSGCVCVYVCYAADVDGDSFVHVKRKTSARVIKSPDTPGTGNMFSLMKALIVYIGTYTYRNSLIV